MFQGDFHITTEGGGDPAIYELNLIFITDFVTRNEDLLILIFLI